MAIDQDGSPDVEAGFPESMEADLPDDRIVNVESNGCGWYEIVHEGCVSWTVSEDMIAKYIGHENVIFTKTYDTETLNALNDDLYDAINQLKLPQDENGFIKGQFTVQIIYKETE